jgi:hypothetical protein
MNPKPHEHRHTHTHTHTNMLKHIHRHTDSRTQGHKDTQTQGHKDTRTHRPPAPQGDPPGKALPCRSFRSAAPSQRRETFSDMPRLKPWARARRVVGFLHPSQPGHAYLMAQLPRLGQHTDTDTDTDKNTYRNTPTNTHRTTHTPTHTDTNTDTGTIIHKHTHQPTCMILQMNAPKAKRCCHQNL